MAYTMKESDMLDWKQMAEAGMTVGWACAVWCILFAVYCKRTRTPGLVPRWWHYAFFTPCAMGLAAFAVTVGAAMLHWITT